MAYVITFFDSPHCGQGKRPKICETCRNDRAWRASMVDTFFDVHDPDFECPHTQEEAKGAQLIIPKRLKAMNLAELIAEVREKGAPDRIMHHVRYIEDGRCTKSKCPGCAQARVVRKLREWLAEEELNDGP